MSLFGEKSAVRTDVNRLLYRFTRMVVYLVKSAKVSSVSVASKLFAGIILRQSHSAYKIHMLEDQVDFQRGHGFINRTSVQQVAESEHTFDGLTAYLYDLKAAFDSVYHLVLWRCL